MVRLNPGLGCLHFGAELPYRFIGWRNAERKEDDSDGR